MKLDNEIVSQPRESVSPAPDDSTHLRTPALSRADASDSLPPVEPGSQRGFSMHVAWTLAARLGMAFNSVVAGIIVARWLGADGLGALAVINVAVATVVQFGNLGLPSANIYMIARDRRHLAPAATNSFIFALFGGSLLALCLTALAIWQPTFFNSLPAWLVGIVAISIPFQLISLLGLTIFLALGLIERFNWLDLAGQTFTLINAVLALVLLRRGLWTLLSLNAAASALAGLWIVWLIIRHIKSRIEHNRLRPSWKLFREMVRYGVKFHISILAGLLIFRLDLLIVNHFDGAAEAGVYSVASQVGMMLMLLPGVISTLLFPHITSAPDEHGEKTCVVSRHTAFVMFMICLAAAPVGFALPFLYGARFADVPMQLLILLPGVYVIGIESVLVQHFNASGLPPAIPLFWLVTLIVNLTLTFALVPTFGARGAALASTISYTLIFLLVALYFRAKVKRPLADALLLRGTELRELVKTAKRFSLSLKRV